MYHFINQWDHLKNLSTVSKLPVQVLGASQDYQNLLLPKSQNVVGRLISFGIKCTWTDQDIAQLADGILKAVQKATKTVSA